MKVLDLFQGTEAIKGAVVGVHRVPSTLLWQLWRASNQRICQMLKMPDHPLLLPLQNMEKESLSATQTIHSRTALAFAI